MTWVAFGAHLLARAAYVGFVWVSLWRQQTRATWTRRWGVEGGFQRFRRVTSILMVIDGATFVAVCLVGAFTLPPALPRGVVIGAGVLLVVTGIATKLWAAATLGERAYYWYDFFTPIRRLERATTGPYAFLENPMYTVGYLQAYGLALVTGSVLGLAASLVDQAAILAFHRVVEREHFERASRQAA